MTDKPQGIEGAVAFDDVVELEVLQCPHGHKVVGPMGRQTAWAVAINNTRITGMKCCGSWETIMRTRVKVSTLRPLDPAVQPLVEALERLNAPEYCGGRDTECTVDQLNIIHHYQKCAVSIARAALEIWRRDDVRQ